MSKLFATQKCYVFLHTERSVLFMTDTREYIIDEAYKLFLNNSYEAVSISIISEAIGLTKGALYHHFENKEQLFKAVIDKHFTFAGVSVDEENITLKEYTDECIRHTQTILTHIFKDEINILPLNYLSLVADCLRHYKGFADSKFFFIDEEVRKVSKILENALKRGEIRNDIDTNIVALQYVSLSIGLASDIIRNKSVTEVISSMKTQLTQLYNLLKI
jgi:TetR/AcrR family transcriptional regulator, transcriptional repressor for nem operon